MATYQKISILPKLIPYVKSIEIEEPGSDSFSLVMPYRVLPELSVVMGFQYQGSIYLLENGQKRKLGQCGISGLQTHHKLFQPENSTTKTILVRLYPWAINIFFGEDAFHFTNQALALNEIVGVSSISCLEEQLAQTKEVNELSLLVQNFLLNLLESRKKRMVPNSVIAFTQHLLLSGELGSIKQLAKDYGLSIRNLERHFKSIIGMSPKKFLRLSQFQRALSHLQSGGDWEEIIASLNYYDQAHFINSFKQFSGFPPGQFKTSNA